MTEQDHTASKISLVLADVDGTLVTADKVLTPRARAAVKALHSAGIAFERFILHSAPSSLSEAR
jgi:ribonucleotide monophosphatase NagD (HAD superfamily)